MQPHRQITCAGLAFFVWVRAPRLPYTRFSAWSRMAQVFSTTTSAWAGSSVNVQPMASSMPMMYWLSATFCWQPKVSTSARRGRSACISFSFASKSRWRSSCAAGICTCVLSKRTSLPPAGAKLKYRGQYSTPGAEIQGRRGHRQKDAAPGRDGASGWDIGKPPNRIVHRGEALVNRSFCRILAEKVEGCRI